MPNLGFRRTDREIGRSVPIALSRENRDILAAGRELDYNTHILIRCKGPAEHQRCRGQAAMKGVYERLHR